MKFSANWLADWCDHGLNVTTLGQRLTMAGLELEAIDPAAPAFSGVIVGLVKALDLVEGADQLKLCSVITTDKTTHKIICAANNVAAGLKVAVALPGSELPGIGVLGERNFKGIRSEGMLCSLADLGMEEQSEGLFILPEDAPLGAPLWDYLQLDDHIVDVYITPNRGDCLSIAGLAREVSALLNRSVTPPPMHTMPVTCEAQLQIDIEAQQGCPRYVGRVIRNINLAGVHTPIWMQERLRRSGMRSINPVVDVTNYVMLELGQPMHAFDLSTLEFGIVVRMANPGEKMQLLDGREVSLQEDMLLIADHKHPVAIAGIMGGLNSGINATTKDLFLESAYFTPEIIAGRARRLGLNTESSMRFERGVAPDLQIKAIERATQLLLDLVGGEVGPIEECSVKELLPEEKQVSLRAARLQRLLGCEIPAADVMTILQGLDLAPEITETGWRVTVPPQRFDISIEEDLIEEVVRVYGFDKIPSKTPSGELRSRSNTETAVALQSLQQCLIAKAYQEVVTFSFVAAELQQKVAPHLTSYALANPISPEMAVMRTSLLPGLLQCLLYNNNRQQPRVRIFETGMRFFISEQGELEQQTMLAGLISGARMPLAWHSATAAVDYFDIKADVEALLDFGGCSAEFSFAATQHPALHPGQTAAVLRGTKTIGWLGALHPQLAESLEIREPTFYFECMLDELLPAATPRYSPISKFPGIRRDLAIVIAEDVPVASLQTAVASAAGEYLRDFSVFDIYRGKGIEAGKKSVAMAMILQHNNHTLVDTEVNQVMDQVITALRSVCELTIRE